MSVVVRISFRVNFHYRKSLLEDGNFTETPDLFLLEKKKKKKIKTIATCRPAAAGKNKST